MGLLGLAYIVLRSSGKYFGAWIGGTLGKAEPTVRNNLGFGLLSQAGVAIGLALASASRFSEYGEEGIALGTLIINVITATTFVCATRRDRYTPFFSKKRTSAVAA